MCTPPKLDLSSSSPLKLIKINKSSEVITIMGSLKQQDLNVNILSSTSFRANWEEIHVPFRHWSLWSGKQLQHWSYGLRTLFNPALSCSPEFKLFNLDSNQIIFLIQKARTAIRDVHLDPMTITSFTSLSNWSRIGLIQTVTRREVLCCIIYHSTLVAYKLIVVQISSKTYSVQEK